MKNLTPALVFCQSPPNHLPTVYQGQNRHEIEERNSNNASPISKVYQRLRKKNTRTKVRKSEQIKKVISSHPINANLSTLIISPQKIFKFSTSPPWKPISTNRWQDSSFRKGNKINIQIPRQKEKRFLMCITASVHQRISTSQGFFFSFG